MTDKFKTVIIGPPGSKLPEGTKIDDVTDATAADRVIDMAEPTVSDKTPMYFVVALLLFMASGGLAVAGVYILFGLGCSLLAGAVACAGAAVILLRGLRNEPT